MDNNFFPKVLFSYLIKIYLKNIILVLLMHKYKQEKLLLVKKNIFKQKKMVLHLLIEINQHYILQ